MNKIGLALGSGGFRGPAHVGVLKVLLANNIPIDFLTGTSFGAIVAAHYALYKDIEKLEIDIFGYKKEKTYFIFDISRRGGILTGERVEKLFRQIFNNAQFKDLKIPLKIVATDLITGEPTIFDKGDLTTAIRASMSVPPTFKPLKWKNKLLVDGALTIAVPDKIVKDMGADKVISVNLYNKYNYNVESPSAIAVTMRSMEIILYNLTAERIKHTDLLIQPDTTISYKKSRLKKYFDEETMKDLLLSGEKATQAKIPEILKLLN